jgi:hypothetical protein
LVFKKIKNEAKGARYALKTNVLHSGNGNETKLIRLDPIMISFGTSRCSNAENSLFIFIKL